MFQGTNVQGTNVRGTNVRRAYVLGGADVLYPPRLDQNSNFNCLFFFKYLCFLYWGEKEAKWRGCVLFCKWCLVTRESGRVSVCLLVSTISAENEVRMGELPACAQSQVRIRWEWASSSENGCWSLFALTQPAWTNEPNEPPACNTFPLSMYSTTCKWFLQRSTKFKNTKTDNLGITDLYPAFRVWRL